MELSKKYFFFFSTCQYVSFANPLSIVIQNSKLRNKIPCTFSRVWYLRYEVRLKNPSFEMGDEMIDETTTRIFARRRKKERKEEEGAVEKEGKSAILKMRLVAKSPQGGA